MWVQQNYIVVKETTLIYIVIFLKLLLSLENIIFGNDDDNDDYDNGKFTRKSGWVISICIIN